MLFATIVAFVWQSRYGSLSLNLFFAMILAYIFKDRIKEVLRAKLLRRFREWLPDRRLRIMRTGTAGTEIGRCDETFDFLSSKQIPPEVARLRRDAKEPPFSFMTNGRTEQVFRYRKTVDLAVSEAVLQFTERQFVDITRFNLRIFCATSTTSIRRCPNSTLTNRNPLERPRPTTSIWHAKLRWTTAARSSSAASAFRSTGSARSNRWWRPCRYKAAIRSSAVTKKYGTTTRFVAIPFAFSSPLRVHKACTALYGSGRLFRRCSGLREVRQCGLRSRDGWQKANRCRPRYRSP